MGELFFVDKLLAGLCRFMLLTQHALKQALSCQ